MAILAATRAIGYPVAFDASAELRETRGLTSMTKYGTCASGSLAGERSGSSANWTLHPPSIPSARMIRSAAERSIWYSLSVSVCDGATTMESPVCTPIGSMFSMLQTVMHVSAPSRITSYSTSFQPRRDRSTSTWPIGQAAERGKESARPLLLDDPLEHVGGERLEVSDVRDAGVGHDRRGIGVHEDGLDAFFA